MPNIPPNADALIDYALSHIPERGGPRGTRKKKRLARKAEAIKVSLVSVIFNLNWRITIPSKKIHDKKKEEQKNAVERKQVLCYLTYLIHSSVQFQYFSIRLRCVESA
jgi:hypothetical protein